MGNYPRISRISLFWDCGCSTRSYHQERQICLQEIKEGWCWDCADVARRFTAREFAKVLGRVPTFFRTSVKNLHLFPGKLGEEACGAWGHFKTGTISLCVEDGLEKIKKGTCEELFVHECTHVTVDPLVLQDAAAYACAMSKDQQFISTYAKMNPFVEDVAESLLMWYAVRVKQDRLDKKTKDIIEQTIPNRLEYFDMAAKNYLR